MVDKLGNEIKPGVWIIYGHALGRCAGLRLGKVLAVQDASVKGECPWNNKDKITVWGFYDDHVAYSRYNPNDEWAKPKPLTKTSTLQFSDRCIVVPERSVPKEYRDMIEEVLSEGR